jgi:hypothetical protein
MADAPSYFSWRLVRPCLLLLAVLMGGFSLSSCGFMGAAEEQQNGKQVDATYKGLDDKTLAIVVYTDMATTLEYPDARKEISAFLTAQFHQNMPKVRLVNYMDVIHWQDDTQGWEKLPEKDIGTHFSVDRVLYIELLDYRTREPGGLNLLRGRIQATAAVFEVDMPAPAAVWQQAFDVYWPDPMPEDVLHGNDDTVRKRVLEEFSDQVVGCFYDHKKIDKSAREKSE